MNETIPLVHDVKRKAIQFTDSNRAGDSPWYPYDASSCALSTAIENLIKLNGSTIKIISVERTNRDYSREDFMITYSGNIKLKSFKPTTTVDNEIGDDDA